MRMIGRRLGVYQVEALLGAGGMGEVYRARDTRLNRDVAIKVLPESFAADAERVARLTREAQTLAALNHSQIAQVHGLEDAEGTLAIVMEFVEGEDLAERLKRGPIPLDDALPIARQIAEALEAAHEQGIVHRDLKPANIKLRGDGTIKVLDFGLATARGQGRVPLESVANSPTFTSPAITVHGVILGTAAYMAPEQARGKPVDRRADIWAFGCVLYEMLTGVKAFDGEDVTEILGAIVKADPDWSRLPSSTPSPIRRLLRRCVTKDRSQRLQHIGDARLEIAEATRDEPIVVARKPWRWLVAVPWVIAAVSVAAAAAAMLAPTRSTVATGGLTRFALQPLPGAGFARDPVLSADGTFVVYSADRLYVHQLSEFDPRALPGTEGASTPFLSPDGRWVGFYAGGKMLRVPVAGGGDPQLIANVSSDTPGATWLPDGRVLFTNDWNEAPLMSVPAEGGAVTPVSTVDSAAGERGHWWAQALPDGRHVLFTIWVAGAGLADARIAVLDLETGKHRVLLKGARGMYAGGHLIYYAAGLYQMVPFDAASQTVGGEPTPVLPEAQKLAHQGDSIKPVSVAANGAIAYVARELVDEFAVSWFDRRGTETPTPLKLRIEGEADLSRDGTRLAFGEPNGGVDKIRIVRIHDPAGSTLTLVTEGSAWGPVWHPDGERLAFTSMTHGDFDPLVQRIDSPSAEVARQGTLDDAPLAWHPDGKRLLIEHWTPGTSEIALVDPAQKTLTTLVKGPFQKDTARISRDARWLAYCANPEAEWRIFVQPMTAERRIQSIATHQRFCSAMRWSPVADELFFVDDGRLTMLQYSNDGDRFNVRGQQVIAGLPGGSVLFGVSPDGQRLLVGKPVVPAGSAPAAIRVMLDGVAAFSAARR